MWSFGVSPKGVGHQQCSLSIPLVSGVDCLVLLSRRAQFSSDPTGRSWQQEYFQVPRCGDVSLCTQRLCPRGSRESQFRISQSSSLFSSGNSELRCKLPDNWFSAKSISEGNFVILTVSNAQPVLKVKNLREKKPGKLTPELHYWGIHLLPCRKSTSPNAFRRSCWWFPVDQSVIKSIFF